MSAGRTARLAVVGGLVAVVVVLAVMFTSSNGSDHEITLTAKKASGVVKGQQLRSGGNVVGQISDIAPVDRGRKVKLTFKVDDKAWPLPKGSTMTLRTGGTINQYNRYIQLDHGPRGGPRMVNDGGAFPPSAFKTPVEYVELLKVFNKQARGDLKQLLDNGGRTLRAAGPQVNNALDGAAPAVDQADHVLRDLNASDTNLKALITSTTRVTDSIDTADPGLSELVQGAGSTLSATADRANDVQTVLRDSPATMRHAQRTLRTADTTLVEAKDLTRRIDPGVDELRRIATPLNSVLGTLVDVGPDARSTLNTLGRAAPSLTRLADKASDQSPQLTSIFKQGTKALDCIRPWTPDFTAFFSLWSGNNSSTDGKDKYIRAQPQSLLPAAGENDTRTPGEVARNNPGLKYAYPAPPGFAAGQPWLQPQCGVTEKALDPSQDPELPNAIKSPSKP